MRRLDCHRLVVLALWLLLPLIAVGDTATNDRTSRMTEAVDTEEDDAVAGEAAPTVTVPPVSNESLSSSAGAAADDTSTDLGEQPKQPTTTTDTPKQRIWGTPPLHEEDEHVLNHKETDKHKDDGTAAAAAAAAAAMNSGTGGTTTATSTTSPLNHHPPHHHHHHNSVHIPFKHKATHTPPPGFVIAARVYIDSSDKLAYIDEDPLTLPYWDCGAVGSTTTPLAVKEATFRHSLTPGQSWTGTDGKHPYLCVALSEFQLEVSSGETKVIQPGQVILLEDVLIPGHKLRPLHPHHDVRVMFLTLPKSHYTTGKEALSLPTTVVNDPCPVEPEEGQRLTPQALLRRDERQARLLRIFLGVAGLSVSTLLADFLGKTAPLWLAVGVGGACFVVAGTAGTIAMGEAVVHSIQAWMQQRRLQSSPPVIPKVEGVTQ